MFRYIKAFKILMKDKDLEKMYQNGLEFSATMSFILGLIYLYITNEVVLNIITVLIMILIIYFIHCTIRLILINEKDNIKNFFKELKETANKLK